MCVCLDRLFIFTCVFVGCSLPYKESGECRSRSGRSAPKQTLHTCLLLPTSIPLVFPFMLCSLWQRVRCEKWAAFVSLTSLNYPAGSLAPCKCLTPLFLSPSPPLSLSAFHLHRLVFEGLICFSPAAARQPCTLLLCLQPFHLTFLILVAGRFSSELVKQTCVTLTIRSWRWL